MSLKDNSRNISVREFEICIYEMGQTETKVFEKGQVIGL